jgi:hypothetical protein
VDTGKLKPVQAVLYCDRIVLLTVVVRTHGGDGEIHVRQIVHVVFPCLQSHSERRSITIIGGWNCRLRRAICDSRSSNSTCVRSERRGFGQNGERRVGR